MSRRSIAAAILVPLVLLIAALAAPAAQAGGGCHGGAQSPPGDGESSVIKIDGCMFFPTIARVPVGTTVRFLNTGQVPHNVTGVAGTWASGDFAGGAEYRHAFSAPGVYPFACTLHPGMNGAIVVGGDGAPAPVAPAMTNTSAVASETEPATVDLVPLAIAGLAGVGIGAIGAGAIATRRRRPIN